MSANLRSNRPTVFFASGLVLLVILLEVYFRHTATHELTSDDVRDRALFMNDRYEDCLKTIPRNTKGVLDVLQLGNSHSYTIPGKHYGDDYVTASHDTLQDYLKKALAQQAGRAVSMFGVAYPGFNPGEQFAWLMTLVRRNDFPDLAILGVSFWDSNQNAEIRDEIRTGVLFERGLAGEGEAFLKEQRLDLAAKRWKEATELGAKNRASEKGRGNQTEWTAASILISLGMIDRVEASMQASLSRKSWAFKERYRIREAVVRTFVDAKDFVVALTGKVNVRSTVVSEEEVNLEYLKAIFRLLSAKREPLIVYVVPIRHDIPLPFQERDEREWRENVEKLARENGALFVDANSLLPDSHFGYEKYRKDPRHFDRAGQQALAQFIVRSSADYVKAIQEGK